MKTIENKKVAGVMHHGVITIAGNTPAKNICKIMTEHKVSCVIVNDCGGSIPGIVSNTDLLKIFERCNGTCEKPEDCPEKADNVMTKNAITVNAGDDLTQAIRLLNENKIHQLPVISGGKPIGILSASDIRREITKNSVKPPEAFHSRFEKYEGRDDTQKTVRPELKNTKINEVMTPGVIMIPVDICVTEAAKILSEKNIRGVVVITDAGEMIGIVSDTDFLKAFTKEFEGRKIESMIAGDIMTPGIETIEHCRTLEEGTGVMNDKHIHRLLVLFDRPCEVSPPAGFRRKPIMSHGIVHGVNIPVGILSASDIVREIAKR